MLSRLSYENLRSTEDTPRLDTKAEKSLPDPIKLTLFKKDAVRLLGRLSYVFSPFFLIIIYYNNNYYY